MIRQMTTIGIAGDKEKNQQHEIPLFPCSVYISDWQKGAIEGCHWHWHKDLELMYVISGQVVAQCNGQSSVLGQGNGIFFNTKSLHRYQMHGKEPCHICYIIFQPDLISGGIGTIYHQKYIAPLISDQTFPCQFLYEQREVDKQILQEIKLACQAAETAQPGYEYDIRYHIGKALLQLLLEYKPLAYKAAKKPLRMERMHTMLDFLHWHFNEEITLQQIANSAGVSGREAQRCFKNILDMSPMEYLHSYRLQVAEELLISSTDSILDVGMNCGFMNPSHFIKSFKNYCGCTPRVFRQRNTELS